MTRKQRKAVFSFSILAVAIGALWILSYREITYGLPGDIGQPMIGICNGSFHFMMLQGWAGPWGWSVDCEVFSRYYGWWPDLYVRTPRNFYGHIPFWLMLVFAACYPTWTFVWPYFERQSKRYRQAHGLCVRCEYDLRSSPAGVCPECGKENAVPPTQVSE